MNKVYAVIRLDRIDYSEETTAVFAVEDDAIKDAATKNLSDEIRHYNWGPDIEYRVQPWDVQ